MRVIDIEDIEIAVVVEVGEADRFVSPKSADDESQLLFPYGRVGPVPVVLEHGACRSGPGRKTSKSPSRS